MCGEEQLCEMRLDWQRLFASRLTFISYLLKPVRILKIRLFLFRLESGPAEERRGECRRARQLPEQGAALLPGTLPASPTIMKQHVLG